MQSFKNVSLLGFLSLSAAFMGTDSVLADPRPLKEVMQEMSPKLQALTTKPLDESAIPNADALKKLALEASVLAPANLTQPDILAFEGLLLDIALKSNQIEQAILAKDPAKSAALVKEITALKSDGHMRF